MNSDFNTKLNEMNLKLLKALKQVETEETENAKLKREIEAKLKQEQELKERLEKQSDQHENFSSQLNEKISEIEFLNRENNSLLERIHVDEKRINITNSELENYKNKVLNLNSQLDLKMNEIMKFENIFKNKDTEIAGLNLKINVKEIDLKHKIDECEKLQLKYQNISSDLDSKVHELVVEIERLKSDKKKLSADLYELRTKHSLNNSNHHHYQELNNDHKTIVSCPPATSIQNTSAAIHTNNLKNIELLATKTKFETKINVYELELNNLKAKIGKLLKVSINILFYIGVFKCLLKEKEIQEHVLKENQRLTKDIAHKYSIDSESWNRQRQQFIEKEHLVNKYEFNKKILNNFIKF
jgi:chromosome segregation ATPase